MREVPNQIPILMKKFDKVYSKLPLITKWLVGRGRIYEVFMRGALSQQEAEIEFMKHQQMLYEQAQVERGI